MDVLSKNLKWLRKRDGVSVEELNKYIRDNAKSPLSENAFSEGDIGVLNWVFGYELVVLKDKFNVSIDDLIETDLEAKENEVLELSENETDLLMANLSGCAYEAELLKQLVPELADTFEEWKADYAAELAELGENDGRYCLLGEGELQDIAGRLRGELIELDKIDV